MTLKVKGSMHMRMASNPPKRPTTLALQTKYTNFTLTSHQIHIKNMKIMPELSLRRTLSALQGQDSFRGIRKSKCLHILIIIMVFLIVIFYRPSLPGFLSRTVRHVCSEKDIVYMEGKKVCYKGPKLKYLTYQPPGGGWNNQRLAFENAVIIAKMLNRTLMVHPMAMHNKILDIRKRQKFTLNYQSYNALQDDALVPLSNVIDLKRLSKILPVKEIRTGHTQFLKDYGNLSWRRVCHNGLIGIWVDAMPKEHHKGSWDALEEFKNSWIQPSNIPRYRNVCQNDKVLRNETSVWGIMDELHGRNEDVLYFAEGSMFFRRMLFFDLERTLEAHKWIFWYVTFAPQIYRRLRLFKQRVHFPYNAIHIRRTDHPTSHSIRHDYWLALLNKRRFLNVTSTLYVATDEKNLTWFTPFRKAGFDLLFANNFSHFNFENDGDVNLPEDMIGLTEQLICAHAANFIGSYYSTFSLYIKRLRKQSKWRGELVKSPLFGVTWIGK